MSVSINKILLIVFLLAFLPRIGAVLLAPHPPSAHWDVAHDVIIARNLAGGHGFANEPDTRLLTDTRSYPLFSLCFSVFSGRDIFPSFFFSLSLGRW
ncbi:MAG: hypothetical protein K8S15_13820 [Candidatus Aegiribacteria sp.]|nr:hypothetical protein [Candidatus Aegiribacteria sp.]